MNKTIKERKVKTKENIKKNPNSRKKRTQLICERLSPYPVYASGMSIHHNIAMVYGMPKKSCSCYLVNERDTIFGQTVWIRLRKNVIRIRPGC